MDRQRKFELRAERLDNLRRRKFTTLTGAAALAHGTAAAQPAAIPVVGLMGTAGSGARPDVLPAFQEGLKEAGYSIGRNLRLDYRSVEGRYDRLPALALEFAALNVAVLVAPNIQAAVAAHAATRSIPIAFHSGVDPVAFGLIESLARPGGNATGIFSNTSDLVAKRVQLVRDLIPDARTLAFLVNPEFLAAAFQTAEIRKAAAVARLDLRVVEARTVADIDSAFGQLAARKPDALMVGPDALFTSQRDLIVASTARHGIAAIYDFPDYPAAGGLISYGPNRNDIQRMLGGYVGKILAGARPSDLPVQQPTRFEFVVNLKAARALGLTVPLGLLAAADEVIE